MRDIVFYDFDFNRLADFPKAISVNFEKNFCGFGKAELHYSPSEVEIIALLEENPYMFFVVGDEAAVVTGWRLEEDIAIYARTLEWLLTKRGVEPFSRTDATPELIVRDAVNSAAGDFIGLGTALGTGSKMSYKAEDVKVLHDVVCEVLNAQDFGFRVVPDINRKKFIFEVLEGTESLCLLSTSNRTAYNMKYMVDKQNMADGCGWYKRRYIDKGSWDAENNSPSISDNQGSNAYTFYRITSNSYDSRGDRIECFGLWCRKDTYLYSDDKSGKWKISESKPDTIWIYLGTPNETGAKKWDAVLNGIKTEEEALTELAAKILTEKSETETKGIEYGKDYRLGDVVGVQMEFGEFKKATKKRVVSVNIYYDTDGSGVIPVLSSKEERKCQ